MIKCYILKRGIKEEVYGNLSLLCRVEGLEYDKVYRSIKSRKSYSQEDVYVVEKHLKRSFRPNHIKRK